MGVVGVADSGDNHKNLIWNWQVHHNTVYDVVGGGRGAGFHQGTVDDPATACEIYNNLFVDVVHPVISTYGEHDHNAFFDCSWLGTASEPDEPHLQLGSGDPFVDAAAGDLHLAIATDPGRELPAPYDSDADGTPRGDDGNWDRGAYERR